jgi:acyl carrier protein
MLEKKIADIVTKTLGITSEEYALSLGVGDIPQWDSLAHVTLLQHVEKEFNFTFEVADALDIETVDDLVDKIKEYLTGTTTA